MLAIAVIYCISHHPDVVPVYYRLESSFQGLRVYLSDQLSGSALGIPKLTAQNLVSTMMTRDTHIARLRHLTEQKNASERVRI